jgi:uncharacterized repeat protein (TIGR02543 family)
MVMATTISVKVNKGQTYSQALTKAGVGNPTRANYNFAGWNTKSDGTGETRLSSQVAVKSETVYAQWQPTTISVSYPARPVGVSSFFIYKNEILQVSNPLSAGSFTVNYGDTVYATANQSAGYNPPTITGVSTNSSAPTIVTSAISIGLTAGNPISYTLSFNFNGGSGSPSSKSVTYNSQIGTLPTPTRANYTFDGWKIDGTAITASPVWNYTENITAVAQWTSTKTNNFISVNYDGARPSAQATYAVTSQITVGMASESDTGKTSVISIGNTIGSLVQNPILGSVWYITDLYPHEDDTYYYSF